MESARLLAVVLSFLYRLVHRAFGALKYVIYAMRPDQGFWM